VLTTMNILVILYSSLNASEVMTSWHYTDNFIIIIINIT